MSAQRRPPLYSQLSLSSVFQRHRERSQPAAGDTPCASNEVAQLPLEQRGANGVTSAAASTRPASGQEGESGPPPAAQQRQRQRSIVGSRSDATVQQQAPGPAQEEATAGPSGACQAAISNRCWHMLERQLTGRLPPAALPDLRARLWHSYAQIGWAACSPWQPRREVLDPFDESLMGWAVPSDHIASAAFDARGELLVAASAGGSLSLLHMDDLAAEAARNGCAPPDHAQPAPTDVSRLRLESGRRLERCRWNGADERWVGAVASSDRSLALYDLASCRGAPTQTLQATSVGCRQRGFMDLAFLPGDPYQAAAAGNSGQVCLWDGRRGALPRAIIEASAVVSEVTSLHATPDGRSIVTANSAGDVLVWDLRGGGGAPRFGGRGPRTHALARFVGLRAALGRLRQLTRQTEVPQPRVQALLPHPESSLHFAFSLACGWAGVLDVAAGEVTHLHCPPQLAFSTTDAAGAPGEQLQQPLAALASAWPRRLPCWAGDSVLCLGAGRGCGLTALDLSLRRSPCAVDGSGSEGRPTSVRIPLADDVISTAFSRGSQALVAGTRDGRLLLLG